MHAAPMCSDPVRVAGAKVVAAEEEAVVELEAPAVPAWRPVPWGRTSTPLTPASGACGARSRHGCA